MHKLSDLEIYKKSLELAVKIYKITNDFPKDEKFGIISQMRRASSSIGANIAEGYSRKTVKDKNHFHTISKGSLSELIYFLDLSEKLEFIETETKNDLTKECKSLDVKIHNFMKYLEK